MAVQRLWVVLILMGLLVSVSACGRTTAPGNGSSGLAPAPDPTPAGAPAPPTPGGDPVDGDPTDGDPADPGPAGAGTPALPATGIGTSDPPVADAAALDPRDRELAALSWTVREIGYPMTSPDPAAAGKKVVMLTFDDGPDPEVTPLILAALKQHGVRAMWFVTERARHNEDLLKRIAAAGHVIGTHTTQHQNLTQLDQAAQRAAIVPVNETVERVTGRQVRFFRPPYGAYNRDTLALMQKLDLTLLNWSHGSGDWMNTDSKGAKDPAEVVADVLATTPRRPGMTALHPGAVILMHDTHRHTAAALPAIISGLREQGYGFVVLGAQP